ncbi:MAG TPA: hypothetical protein VH249_06245 [Xanthobacteraceae bacterium]|jgi:hypothetical protein|nr:hypothetical protein [Xanthobacteraceae bacterium]
MTGNFNKRIAKLEAKRRGGQIPIICEEESQVPALVERMIEAGELAEADRSRCVYWLDCVGPNALTDAQLRALLALCDAEAAPEREKPKTDPTRGGVNAPGSG